MVHCCDLSTNVLGADFPLVVFIPFILLQIKELSTKKNENFGQEHRVIYTGTTGSNISSTGRTCAVQQYLIIW